MSTSERDGQGETQLERLLKIPEVAERLQLSRTTIYELLLSGRLRSVKIGRARRIPEAALDAWVQGQGTAPIGR